MVEWLTQWMESQNTGTQLAVALSYCIGLTVLITLSIAVNFIAKRIILALLNIIAKKSKNTFDDAMFAHKVPQKLAHLGPALVIYMGASTLPLIQVFLERLSMAGILFIGLSSFFSLIDAGHAAYQSTPLANSKPIKGYLQVLKLLLTVLATIFVVSTLMDRSPWGILSGIGAVSAILILVFKDAILGLVAGFQLSANKMLQIGDWIEMPKYGADGDVIEINLATVKVRNWDKTISTVPTYTLISDSFKNWRGMSESGGRRIKRSINIDLNSIRFVDEPLFGKLNKIQLLQNYLSTRKKEIEEHNREHKWDPGSPVNGRRLTNVGCFRAYASAYLRNHPLVHQEMTFLVRQLQPTPTGLPLEIYVFSRDQVWANYESIQADIFDHFLAVLPEFDLSVYQQPSGRDIQEVLAGRSS